MVSNPKRLVRTGMNGKPFRCPFCQGNEEDTPPEVYRVGKGEKDKPGWEIRVVPNLFPITEVHEVVIHSPDHEKNLEDFSLTHVENIIKTYINRFIFLKNQGQVYIFHNYSLISGASLIHPHSQITVIPNDIPTNTLSVQPVVNIVEQVGEFVSYCPDYSEWSYELWIKKITNYGLQINSKSEISNFQNLNEEEIGDLAKILQSSIKKLKKIHAENPHYSKKPFGYNYYISIPQRGLSNANFITRESHRVKRGPLESEKFAFASSFNNHWYLRIIPRFMERAGFELSTGIMVNSVEAKRAADEFKK